MPGPWVKQRGKFTQLASFKTGKPLKILLSVQLFTTIAVLESKISCLDQTNFELLQKHYLEKFEHKYAGIFPKLGF